MAKVRDGGVAVRDVEDEQVEGGGGMEPAVAPAMCRVAAGIQDHVGGKREAEAAMDLKG